MSEYKIEKNVQIPSAHSPTKYPFDKMEPGDSFSFPIEKATSLRNSAYSYAKNHAGTKFMVKVGRDLRCWRVS
jgi:hypothetical protein